MEQNSSNSDSAQDLAQARGSPVPRQLQAHLARASSRGTFADDGGQTTPTRSRTPRQSQQQGHLHEEQRSNIYPGASDVFGTTGNKAQQPSTPGKSVLEIPAEPFDYEDFRARYDAAMNEQLARDQELVAEYKRVVVTYQAWVSVVGQWDQNVDTGRREDHIAHLIEKEQKLEQYRRKSLAVLNQVESAFQQMEDGDK